MNGLRRFEPLGKDYAASVSHAQGRTLGLVMERAVPKSSDLCLDVGTGTGHMALALAVKARAVVGADPAAGMLAEGVRLAGERGMRNLSWVRAEAGRLPFRDASFDLVTSRTAAHHFPDLAAACREWARLLRSAGRCVVTDLQGHEDAALQAFVHGIEVLHDPSHVRSHPTSAWRAALSAAGLAGIRIEEGFLETEDGMSLADWCRRSRTPAADMAEIARRLRSAPGPWRDLLGVREEGGDLRFRIWKLVASAARR